MRFCIQLYPPCTASKIGAHSAKATNQYSSDKVWVPDYLTNENVFVVLGAIIDVTHTQSGPVIAGTSPERIAGVDKMLRAAEPYDFDIVDITSTLGPNWDESIHINCREIIPEIEQRAATY